RWRSATIGSCGARLPSRLSHERSILVFRKNGERHELDTVLDQRAGLVECRLAIDAPRFGFAKMDLAGFLGELVTDIVGVLARLFGHQLELRERLALLLAHGKRDRILLAPGGNSRSHQRFFDLGRVADRARDETTLLLGIEVFAVTEPAL